MKRIQAINRKRIVISVICALVFSITVGIITWSEPRGNTPELIDRVEKIINSVRVANTPDDQGNLKGDIFDQVAPYVELENIIDELTPYNALRAKAKAMIYYDENVDRNSLNAWNKRFELSKEPFRIASFSERVLHVIGLSLLALIGAFIIIWLFLILISWSWYFILDRIAELSDAIRRKPSGDA